MPASLSIAIFIFGAVLLLIGLLGGAFKLFGTEVTGTVGPCVRIAALILGGGFIAWGLAIEHHSPATTAVPVARAETSEPPTPRGTALAAEPAATRTMPATAPLESAMEAFNLTGMWRDETGTVYQVSQHGSVFEFQASNALTGARAEGTGRLQGRNWTSDFRTNIPSTGTGSGMISQDGNQMMGSYRDTSYGSYSHTIARIQ